MGVKICDLGTHSYCKGVATMVAAGCTVSPPIVSIFVRAGWVMGGVKDKYLKRESAGYHHVGRWASWLPILSMDFSVSPPYFDFSGIEDDIFKVASKSSIESWLDARLFKTDEMNVQVNYLAWMLFSTVCFHYDYLNENLNPSSSLQVSPFSETSPQNSLSCPRFCIHGTIHTTHQK